MKAGAALEFQAGNLKVSNHENIPLRLLCMHLLIYLFIYSFMYLYIYLFNHCHTLTRAQMPL